MKMFKIHFCCIIFIILCVPLLNYAQDQSWNLGLKGGIFFPGEVYVNPPDDYFDTEMGWLINISADAMVAPKLSMGGFFLHVNTTDEYFEEDVGINTFGVTLKARFRLASGIQIRPGVAIGYQLINGEELFEDVKGLEVGAVFEIAKPLGSGRAILGELGFITQPSGGNEDIDMTFGPIFF